MDAGLTEDSRLLLLIAGTWLFVAGLYVLLPILDMPPGKRVWTASGLLFSVLAIAVAAVERRAQ